MKRRKFEYRFYYDADVKVSCKRITDKRKALKAFRRFRKEKNYDDTRSCVRLIHIQSNLEVMLLTEADFAYFERLL